jgi:hypothetical protein
MGCEYVQHSYTRLYSINKRRYENNELSSYSFIKKCASKSRLHAGSTHDTGKYYFVYNKPPTGSDKKGVQKVFRLLCTTCANCCK